MKIIKLVKIYISQFDIASEAIGEYIELSEFETEEVGEFIFESVLEYDNFRPKLHPHFDTEFVRSPQIEKEKENLSNYKSKLLHIN